MIDGARERPTPNPACFMNHFRAAWTLQLECREFSHGRTKFRQQLAGLSNG
jgi:hypothetical protein